MSWIAKTFLFSCGAAAALLFALSAALFDPRPILIESLESKTDFGKPVFNKISFHIGLEKETWLMEQSHTGLSAGKEAWDKLGVVVEKTAKNAQFFQYQSGSEEISTELPKADYKVSCYFCHSSGPRAIRPNWNSDLVSYSYWDRFRVFAWNLRIKSYGPLKGVGHSEKVPFKSSHRLANVPLQVAACTKCHGADGVFSRSALTRQNFMAIKFLLENKQMPPPGFSISKEERQAVHQFIGLKN